VAPFLILIAKPFLGPWDVSAIYWMECSEIDIARSASRRKLLLHALAPAIQRGVFHSVADLQAAINRFLVETNSDPKPFAWTANPKRVLATVKQGKEKLESIH
jgi:hypothetical protein